MLETEVCNQGVKFSDTFSLIIRYCLVQTSSTTTNLHVTAHIIYNRSINGFIKRWFFGIIYLIRIYFLYF